MLMFSFSVFGNNIFGQICSQKFKIVCLWRYDTIKTCRLNFFKVSLVVHYMKTCKIRFKSRGFPYYCLSFRGQKIKSITKFEQKRLFFFTFLVSFFMVFLVQKQVYTINIWFNFVFGSFLDKIVLLSYFKINSEISFLQDVLKTSGKGLEDVWPRRIYSWRRFEDVFWRRRRLTSSRRLQDVFIKMNAELMSLLSYFLKAHKEFK